MPSARRAGINGATQIYCVMNMGFYGAVLVACRALLSEYGALLIHDEATTCSKASRLRHRATPPHPSADDRL